MPNNNLNEIPYAQWLEQTLQDIIKLPVKGMCLNAILENGEIYTTYYNATMHDKVTIAGFIQQDAMIDTLAVNGFIKNEEDEDGTEED